MMQVTWNEQSWMGSTALVHVAAAGLLVAGLLLCPGAVQTRICESERNREAAGVSAATHSDTDEAFKNLAGPIVEAGIAPVAVADMIVASIRTNDFWILTHPDWKTVMQERVAGMMDNQLVSGFGG